MKKNFIKGDQGRGVRKTFARTLPNFTRIKFKCCSLVLEVITEEYFSSIKQRDVKLVHELGSVRYRAANPLLFQCKFNVQIFLKIYGYFPRKFIKVRLG